MTRGRLIAISGGEGSGKTSVIAALRERHPNLCITREPGGTPVGAAIRQILLDRAELDPRPLTELLLFFADRAEHCERVLEPSLRKGKRVLTDRYWMDSFAYQWYATMGNTNLRAFLSLVKEFSFTRPTRWIWLDVDPAVGLSRRRGTGLFNRLDRRQLAFHTKVREGYRRLYSAATFPKTRIDANRPFIDVLADAERAIIATR